MPARIEPGRPIGVGIIGANPERGWALRAHVPALASLPGFALRGVATTRPDSARAAAEKFGAAHAFADARALACHPDIDLVTICVKVPHHLELVTAALEAGKAVYCEWPLGRNLAEAETMARLAARMAAPTAIGLQARANAGFLYLRDLIAQGYVGQMRSMSMIASAAFGAEIDAEFAYLAARENGANLFTIPFGHSIDAVCLCLGEFRSLSGTLASLRRTVRITGTDQTIPLTSPDQVALTGILDNGAVAAIHFRAGRSRGTNMLWEINGTEGDLVITAENGHTQYMDLAIQGGRGSQELAPLPIPPGLRSAPAATPAGVPLNVAQIYLLLEQDLRHGTRRAPDFQDALRRHRMLHAIETSAATGARQTYSH